MQDPFERSHNVTKNISHKHFPEILQHFRHAHELLTRLLENEKSTPDTRQDLLSVFVQGQSPHSEKCVATSRTLTLTLDTVCGVLLGIAQYTTLAAQLGELNLDNPHISLMLDRLVLHSIALQLEQEFSFVTSALRATAQGTSTDVPSYLSPLATGPSLEGIQRDEPVQRKRQRSTEEDMEMEMGVEVEGEWGGTKRQRLGRKESADELLCRLAQDRDCGLGFQCTAVEESWVGQRRRRRKETASGSPRCKTEDKKSSGGSDLFLEFTMTSSRESLTNLSPGKSGYQITVLLLVNHVKYSENLVQFFAVFKRWLLSKSKCISV